MVRPECGASWLLGCMLLVSVSGCSWFSEPALEPSDPHLTLALQAALDTNPNIYGRPSPVVVRVFQLANNQAFQRATLSQLSVDPGQVLRADFLGADVFLLRPGERFRYHFIPETRMRDIGVIVEYRSLDEARWRVVSTVEQGKTPAVFVSIGRNSVEFTTPSFMEQKIND
jgi:type VI secretion system protein VasD